MIMDARFERYRRGINSRRTFYLEFENEDFDSGIARHYNMALRINPKIKHLITIKSLSSALSSDRYPFMGIQKLSQDSRVSSELIDSIVQGESNYYTQISIKNSPSGSKRPRLVYSPTDEFRILNRWVYDNVLAPKNDRIHRFAFAYRRGRSTVGCMHEHRSSDWMVRVDLKKFFPSITYSRILGVFLRLGYGEDASKAFAHICSIPSESDRFLPEGFSTSGIISNFAMIPFDNRIGKWAAAHHIRYTRYSDDLIFSGRGNAKPKLGSIMGFLRDVFRDSGFEINHKKTRLYADGSPLRALGIDIIDGDLLPPKRMRVHLESQLWALRKRGLSDQAAFWVAKQGRVVESSVNEYSNHIWGCLIYVHSINAGYAYRMVSQFLDFIPMTSTFGPVTSSSVVRLLQAFDGVMSAGEVGGDAV